MGTEARDGRPPSGNGKVCAHIPAPFWIILTKKKCFERWTPKFTPKSTVPCTLRIHPPPSNGHTQGQRPPSGLATCFEGLPFAPRPCGPRSLSRGWVRRPPRARSTRWGSPVRERRPSPDGIRPEYKTNPLQKSTAWRSSSCCFPYKPDFSHGVTTSALKRSLKARLAPTRRTPLRSSSRRMLRLRSVVNRSASTIISALDVDVD